MIRKVESSFLVGQLHGKCDLRHGFRQIGGSSTNTISCRTQVSGTLILRRYSLLSAPNEHYLALFDNTNEICHRIHPAEVAQFEYVRRHFLNFRYRELIFCRKYFRLFAQPCHHYYKIKISHHHALPHLDSVTFDG